VFLLGIVNTHSNHHSAYPLDEPALATHAGAKPGAPS
jgi:hypothetical protein